MVFLPSTNSVFAALTGTEDSEINPIDVGPLMGIDIWPANCLNDS